jgi:hypothetical protein
MPARSHDDGARNAAIMKAMAEASAAKLWRLLAGTGATHYLNVLSGGAILNREASRDERHELLEQWAETTKVRRRTTRLPTQTAALHAGNHTDWHAALRHPCSNFAAPGLLLIFQLYCASTAST